MTKIKTKLEIEYMTRAGAILAAILREIASAVSAGVTTNELDALANELCKKHKVKPAFLGFNGFPASICASVNDAVVHGIPNDTKLKEGDIVGIDMGVVYMGYYSDSAVTVAVGKVNKDKALLIKATKESLDTAIKVVKDGVHTGDIGHTVSNIAQKYNLGVVRELTGHGIGKSLQEDPSIPNYGKPGTGTLLKAGMTIAIEPMLNLKGPEVYSDSDGWTIRTKDKEVSAHFEHTVLVTKNGARILSTVDKPR